jgi:Spy/CpxP family protein refolding chaperone
MRNNIFTRLAFGAAMVALTATTVSAQNKPDNNKVWSAEKANAWYAQHKWMTGADFIPSTAINQLEMWQADTFDPATIDKELGYAEGYWL